MSGQPGSGSAGPAAPPTDDAALSTSDGARESEPEFDDATDSGADSGPDDSGSFEPEQ
jgi:hypothetical protein